MEEITSQLETMLQGIRPMLRAQGRDASIAQADEKGIVVALSGFCGGCDCSRDYVEGLREMVREQFPDVASVEITTV
jgi:Fe-S cluster biogenesis protein NfuA